MRWKLLMAASLLATLVGAGLGLAATRWLSVSSAFVGTPAYASLAMLLIPLAAIVASGVFVYRHTARRRVLQAIVTVLLVALLTLAALTLGSIYFARRSRLSTMPASQQ